MTVPGDDEPRGPLSVAHPFDITAVKDRLAAGSGGYEIVHWSPGLELGVYVLVAPEPDRQPPPAPARGPGVAGGAGVLGVEGKEFARREGHAVFFPAGANHRFIGYEQLSVLVIFEKGQPA